MLYQSKHCLAIAKIKTILVLLTVLSCALLTFNNPATAQDAGKSTKELKITGILIDRTMTPIGEHFFQSFCAHWSSPEKASFDNITITERFNPQWGSMIWVTIDDEDVMERLLINRNKDMDELAKNVAAAVEQYLLRRELLRHYQQSKDLIGDGY